MQSENDIEAAKQIALRFLEYAARTEAEIRRRLERGAYAPETIEAVVADLERMGLLDDAQFSQEWVESRVQRKGLGRNRLAAELRRKGIGQDIAEEALEAIDEDSEFAAALRLARQRLSPEQYGDPAARRKVAGFLQRRGYSWEMVARVFGSLQDESET